MNKDSTEVYYLKTALTLLAIASKYLKHYGIEANVQKETKNFLNFQVNKVDSVQRDMSARISPELATIMRKELVENWETLSVQNVLGMMVMLNDEKRRQVEEFTEKLFIP